MTEEASGYNLRRTTRGVNEEQTPGDSGSEDLNTTVTRNNNHQLEVYSELIAKLTALKASVDQLCTSNIENQRDIGNLRMEMENALSSQPFNGTATATNIPVNDATSTYMPVNTAAATIIPSTSAAAAAAAIIPVTAANAPITPATFGTFSFPESNMSRSTTNQLAIPERCTTKLYDLPTFSGNTEEWPLFSANFKDTTEAFGYNDMQNMMRLHKSLTGAAKEAVASMLIYPRDISRAMEELEFRFGRPDLLVRVQIDKIQQFPNIGETRLDQVVAYSTKVRNVLAFLTSANCQQHLSNPALLEQMVSKLPPNKQYEWAKHAATIKPYPTIGDFSTWLGNLARIVCLMPTTTAATYSRTTTAAGGRMNVQSQPPRRVMHVNGNEQKGSLKCYHCNEGHSITTCPIFNQNLSVQVRWEKVKQLQLCFSCLHKGHNTSNCRTKKICGIDGCRRYHHQSLHEPNNNKPDQQTNKNKAVQSVLSCRPTQEENVLLFKILPVTLFGPNGVMNVFAMFDEGSAISILEDSVASQLGLKGQSQPLVLQWYGDNTRTENSSRVNLEIEGAGEPNKFYVKNVCTIKNLNLPIQSFTKANFKHLKYVPLSDYANVKPALLLGLDHAFLAATSKIIQDGPTKPIAAKTKLGWVAYGPTSVKPASHPVVLHIRPKPQDELHQLVAEYFSTDNFGVNNSYDILDSEENVRAIRIMNETIKYVGKRYEIGLLWKEYPPTLPNSLEMATKRLYAIEKKMNNDSEFAEKYKNEMSKYLENGYARKISDEEICMHSQNIWYLPHFAVHNYNKPDKLRIVFDAAAAVDRTALNTVLLKGPEKAKSLIHILFKFRQGMVGVAADIREMFLQINIRPEDQNAQRFLWRNGNVDEPIQHYVMKSMIFGAVCSPCCAEFVKNSNAEKFKEQFPEAVDAIIERHYVDDFVSSFKSQEEALSICQQVIKINAEAGLELRKFISNHKIIQTTLNSSEKTSHGSESMNMERQSTVDKVLGMYWDTVTDTFQFRTTFHRIPKQVLECLRPPTKRELLGIVMAVFDPFGLLADFLGFSKLLVQETWQRKMDWDEYIPMELNEKWIAWWKAFKIVSEFRISRCYSPNLYECSRIEIHVFVDASQSAFAAVAYFRIVHQNGVDVAFVSGKSRCAPKKLLSIPRLELQAAVLGVRLCKMIRSGHDMKVHEVIFWSDSHTVLCWINSPHRKYKTFVGHRIAEILNKSEQSQWRWVPTSQNTADVATRPTCSPKFQNNNTWISGPEFLKKDKKSWPTTQSISPPTFLEEEIRPLYVIKQASNNLIDVNRFSSYLKLKRTMAWVLRASKIFRSKCSVEGKPFQSGPLTAAEIYDAEKYICKSVQKDHYAEEIAALSTSQRICKGSKIYKLTPYMDEDGLLRVYGRLDEALFLPHDARRPILMPKEDVVTLLMVRYHHEKQHHQNFAVVINEVRQRFWIPNIKSILKDIQRKCIVCKIDKAKPIPPLMGQLPADRVTPYVRPFSYVGVDLFGPFNVAVGRRREKRWAVIFTCLTVRAAHIELAEDLSTDAFIICLRNFINRRGTPVQLRSDNGTNFIGAQKELKDAERLFDMDKLVNEAANKNINWIFNCPANPSSGGCWERLIRIIKRILQKVLHEVAPRVNTLQSVLIEAENIINSRPLTDLPLSSEDDEPLTPNHFLLGCVNSTQTPHPVDLKICLKKQWRIAQNLKDRFWKRWTVEYLPQLMNRTKWNEKVKPLQVGDIVIVCDPSQPRSHWERGRIMKVFTAKDNQVRFAEVRTSHGLIRRPASRLAVLTISSESSEKDSRGVECC